MTENWDKIQRKWDLVQVCRSSSYQGSTVVINFNMVVRDGFSLHLFFGQNM